MKKILLLLPLFATYGCSSLAEIYDNATGNSTQESETAECPESPEGELDTKNVESIDIDNKVVQESGNVRSNKYVGYTFQGKAGQNLRYSTNEALCIWVYTPDNELMNGVELTKDGTYTIQVSTATGSTTFNLEMTLGDANSLSPSPVSQNSPSTFSPSTPPSSPTSQPAPPSSSSSSLTAQQAVQIVQNWLNSKNQIFAPPYNFQLVSRLTTGQRYTQTTGAMNWLIDNNAYYDYKLSQVDAYSNFSSSGNAGSIDVTITEDMILYVNGRVDSQRTTYGPKTDNYRFYFRQTGGSWKIEDVD